MQWPGWEWRILLFSSCSRMAQAIQNTYQTRKEKVSFRLVDVARWMNCQSRQMPVSGCLNKIYRLCTFFNRFKLRRAKQRAGFPCNTWKTDWRLEFEIQWRWTQTLYSPALTEKLRRLWKALLRYIRTDGGVDVLALCYWLSAELPGSRWLVHIKPSRLSCKLPSRSRFAGSMLRVSSAIVYYFYLASGRGWKTWYKALHQLFPKI